MGMDKQIKKKKWTTKRRNRSAFARKTICLVPAVELLLAHKKGQTLLDLH